MPKERTNERFSFVYNFARRGKEEEIVERNDEKLSPRLKKSKRKIIPTPTWDYRHARAKRISARIYKRVSKENATR